MPPGPTRNDRARGLFVVIDGLDGCGKTTQALRIVPTLKHESGREVLHLREPGSTLLGEELRALLLRRDLHLSAGVETLLFAAARAQMLDELVEPALAGGSDVVCERFHASTFAYQAVAGGLAEERVLQLLHDFAGSPAPDVTIVLDLPAEIAAARRASTRDRIEDKGLEFQQRVAAGYRRYAERVSGVAVIRGDRCADEVAADILMEIRRARR